MTAWLKEHGIVPTLSVNKQWLQFDAPAQTVEDIFKTEYHEFEHSSGSKNVACDGYDYCSGDAELSF